MYISKVSLILFGLAALFYAISWVNIASGLAILGIVFEVLMYFSLFDDWEKGKKKRVKYKI